MASHEFNGFKVTNTFFPAVDPDKDLLTHGRYYDNESWFTIGNLVAEDGRRVGYCCHAMLMVIPDQPLKWSLKVSLVDCQTGWFNHYEYSVPESEVTCAGFELDINHEHFKLKGNTKEWTLKVDVPEGSVDVVCKNPKPFIYNGGNGIIPFFEVKQYHIGMPGWETEGTLKLHGEEFKVSGPSWFDRQWGDQPDYIVKKQHDNMKWMWLGIQLDNGVNISGWDQYSLYDKTIAVTTTAVFPDGTHVIADRMPYALENFWRSEESGNLYPSALEFEIPSLKLKLRCEAIPAQQETIPEYRPSCKIEAYGVVSGTMMGEEVSGVCCFEVIGYWKEG